LSDADLRYICEDCQTHFEKIVLNKTQEIACRRRGEEERDSALGVQRGEWLGTAPLEAIWRITGGGGVAVAADALQLNTRSQDSNP